MEDELLCDAWFSVSANFLGRKQAGRSFRESIHYWFHEKNHNGYYSLHFHMIHNHNANSLAHRWYAIYNSINNYRYVVSQVNCTMQLSIPAMEIHRCVVVMYERKEGTSYKLEVASALCCAVFIIGFCFMIW